MALSDFGTPGDRLWIAVLPAVMAADVTASLTIIGSGGAGTEQADRGEGEARHDPFHEGFFDFHRFGTSRFEPGHRQWPPGIREYPGSGSIPFYPWKKIARIAIFSKTGFPKRAAAEALGTGCAARARDPFAQFLERDHGEREGQDEEPHLRGDRRGSE